MTQVEAIAKYAVRYALVRGPFGRITPAVTDPHSRFTQPSSIAALGAGPVGACREQVAEFGGSGPSALIGGGQANPVYATFWHTVLVRVTSISWTTFWPKLKPAIRPTISASR